MSIAMFEKQETREIRARRLDTGETFTIRRTADAVHSMEPSLVREAGEWWIAPPLFDNQVNGFSGVDFQDPDLAPASFRQAIRGLAVHGCGRFLCTLVTDEWSRMLAKVRKIRQWRQGDLEFSRTMAGFHVEGPFLSDQAGFHGAHEPAFMMDPTVERIRELRDAAGDLPVLLTLAPERAGSVEAIREAVRLGIRVSAGHTNATAVELSAARQAGLEFFTHLGNAIPREMDRHDNIVWRVLDHGGFKISLIADSIHVSPPLFRLVHRCIPSSNIVYTTDAMAAAGAPPGKYRLGGMELEVGRDLIVRQPGRSNFAGSALTPVEGVRRTAMMLRSGWREVWNRFSVQPAAWMGIDLTLRTGAGAEFCLVRTDGAETILDVEMFREGRKVLPPEPVSPPKPARPVSHWEPSSQ